MLGHVAGGQFLVVGVDEEPGRRPEVSLRTLPRRTSNRRCSYLCFRSARKEENPLRRAWNILLDVDLLRSERGGKSEQVLWPRPVRAGYGIKIQRLLKVKIISSMLPSVKVLS